ncbi:hypothetical protein JTE90_008558 [Oedothorax gibbosus]|uniref:Tudor domain-containing protein n=1 Tax=Oedothorax gibbosus TaxID=931172 RepID=A0AAV6TY69_9ARAC|nr:hypothetical protein JTE90_008558 [Oedothorax gibbosus]
MRLKLSFMWPSCSLNCPLHNPSCQTLLHHVTLCLYSEDIGENVDSLAECSLYSADTLSDASSFASPESSEKSERTKNYIVESIPNSVTLINISSSGNSVTPKSNLFEPRCDTIDVQTHHALNGTKPTSSDGDIPRVESLLDRSAEKGSLMSSFQLDGFGEVTKIDGDNHHVTNKVSDEAATHEIFSRLLKTPNFNSGSLNPMEELEKMLGFSPKIVENGILHEDGSSGSASSPLEVAESTKLQSVETDSNDSHSSVLDENSLSCVSDDSDRQVVRIENKGSLLSDLDESLCDELDKSCSLILAESKLLPTASSKESPETAEVKTEVLTESPQDQSPNSSHLDDKVLNGSMQTPEADMSLSSSSPHSVDSPLGPNTPASCRTDSFSAETPASCDSPAIESTLESPSKSSPENTSADPIPDSTLTNGVIAEAMSQDQVNCNGDEIPEMDIAGRLSLQSAPSVKGVGNDNCSESSSWEMPDSQCDAFSQSKSDETGLAGSKVPENPNLYVHEFELPQQLCGRLIGKHGKHVKSIKDQSNANVFIKRHPYDPQLKIVVVEGNRSDVNEALDIIRRTYPPSRYPMVSLVKTNMMTTTNVLPESLQLHIPEGASCDVILSSLVSAGHFFLQQPTHPTYPSLSTLDQCMISCYSQVDTPLLPHPVEAGVICAAPILNGWYRAQVVYVYENEVECELKFVDYGGFSQATTASLRQIRSDFMSLPFQASECYLANVRPLDPAEGWSAEATATFEELAQGQILQALIVDYAPDGNPCVHLYRVQGISNMFINKELVERGLAVWVNNNHWDPH